MNPQIERREFVREKVNSARPYAEKAFWGLGLLAIFFVLIFLAVGAVKLTPIAMRAISQATVALFSSESITPIAERTVESDKPFSMSWNHGGKTKDGSYTLSYPCFDGFYMEVKTHARGTEAVFCNKDFSFINTNNEITIIPHSEKFEKVDVPIALAFTRNGDTEASIKGSIAVTVVNGNAKKDADTKPTTINVTAPVENTNTVVRTPTQSTINRVYTVTGTPVSTTFSDPNGKADFRPTILEVGIAGSNNSFISTNTIRRSDRVAVRFRVDNIGTKTSGLWRFNAYLPTFPSYTFNSDDQAPMNPGDSVEFTLTFDRLVDGIGDFRVKLDGADNVPELNENNNEASISIRGL